MSEKGTAKQSDKIVVIKKYANRRLYNTSSSKYITLEHLCQLVKDDVDFVVYDAKSGEDITRSVLTQIILDEEAKGENLLPLSFLKQIIGFYGQSMDWIVPKYLEHMMQSFAQSQDQMNEAMQKSFSGFFPIPNLEAMGKNNMALWEQAVKMFNPLQDAEGDHNTAPQGPQNEAKKGAGGENKPSGSSQLPEQSDIKALQDQISTLQKQIEDLAKKS